MRLKPALYLSAAWLIVVGIGVGVRMNIVRARVPKPDFEDLAGYQRELEVSTNPASKVILKQILDGPADLARERAAAQREGILVDAAQLQRPLPPPGENAAPLYDRWKKLRRNTAFVVPIYGDSLNSGYAYTPAQIAAVQKVLNDHPDVMTLLHQAADKPKCVWVGDWKEVVGIGGPSPYAGFREAAREINTESFLFARQGRFREAIVDQSRGFQIAQQTASTPNIISYLTAVAIESITLSGMENVLDVSGPNAAVAQGVHQAISGHPPRVSFKAALSGEVAMTLSNFALFPSSTPDDLADFAAEDSAQKPMHNPAKRFSPAEKKFLSQMIAAMGAEYIHQMRRLVAVADGPPAPRQVVAASIARLPSSPLNPVDLLAEKELSLLPSLNTTENNRLAKDQAFMAGAAILEVRGRTGVFPARLPGKFPDPYNADKPLKYRREGTGGFVVYSVGATGKFGGGKPGERRWTPSEIAFRYPGPPPKPVPPEMLK